MFGVCFVDKIGLSDMYSHAMINLFFKHKNVLTFKNNWCHTTSLPKVSTVSKDWMVTSKQRSFIITYIWYPVITEAIQWIMQAQAMHLRTPNPPQ